MDRVCEFCNQTLKLYALIMIDGDTMFFCSDACIWHYFAPEREMDDE